MKLTKGDKIRLTSLEWSATDVAKVGMTGIITDLKPMKGSTSVAIDLDGIPTNHGPYGEGFWFQKHEFEVIS